MDQERAQDPKSLAESEWKRAIDRLQQEASDACAKTCAHRWEHVRECDLRWQAVMAAKNGRAA